MLEVDIDHRLHHCITHYFSKNRAGRLGAISRRSIRTVVSADGCEGEIEIAEPYDGEIPRHVAAACMSFSQCAMRDDIR